MARAGLQAWIERKPDGSGVLARFIGVYDGWPADRAPAEREWANVTEAKAWVAGEASELGVTVDWRCS